MNRTSLQPGLGKSVYPAPLGGLTEFIQSIKAENGDDELPDDYAATRTGSHLMGWPMICTATPHRSSVGTPFDQVIVDEAHTLHPLSRTALMAAITNMGDAHRSQALARPLDFCSKNPLGTVSAGIRGRTAEEQK